MIPPKPVLLLELVTVALPPLMVTATIPFATLLLELVAVAFPPPVVCDAKPLAVPVLIVVAFWFVPAALLGKVAGAVPELVQVLSAAVIVHRNCADAGELADMVSNESAAAQPSGGADAKKVGFSNARRSECAAAANTILDSAERETRLRTTLAPNVLSN